MGNPRDFLSVLIILSLPLQFSFLLNFYTNTESDIQKNWDMSKISDLQLDIANRISTYFASASAIVTIFLSYKFKKRRLPITINFIIEGIVWLVYLAISDKLIWLVIVLRAINGILLGFFHSVHISYIMHFAEKESLGHHGCLVQFAMFLSLCFLNFLTFAVSWRTLAVILSIQSFLFAGLIWLVPESPIQQKSSSHAYIFHSPNFKNLLIMITIMFVQCFSGIGFMIDNCPRLMSSIGIDIAPELQSVLTNFIGCLATLVASFIIDIVSVRYMWGLSTFGMVLSLIIYDITLKVVCPNWLGVFSVFLYFLFFGLGSGPIPWLLPGVIFQEPVMIESGCINCFMNRFMDIWFGYLLTYITESVGEFGSVIFNAGFSLAGCLFGLFAIPTMKNVYRENTTLL
ncbi:glucose import [Tritrichomonas musculus]|uniref:Glucose import n=1 Tax=Tritrichomonas musculus TaxID=1915356 RepID=A0ABR2K639_9EUKA